MKPVAPPPQRLCLGIDPGLASTGIALVESPDTQHFRLLHSDSIGTSASAPLPARLERIHALVEKAIAAYRPDVVAVESIFFARNVRSAVLMAHGRGAAILAAARLGIPLEEYSPMEIKQSVVGKGRAGKEQIRQMVGVLLGGIPQGLPDHETDAMACAICHFLRAWARVRSGAATEGGAGQLPADWRGAGRGRVRRR